MKTNHRIGLSRYVAPHPTYGWYVKTLALFALLGGIVLGGALWFHNQQMIKAVGLEQLASNPDALEDQALNMLIFSVTLSGIAYSCLVLLVGAFFFHRVAGPIYRIKRHMLDILEGKPVGSLSLRKTDQLHDVAAVYNELLVKVGVTQSDRQAAS